MRVFYGWWVLGGLFLMYAVSNGISNFTLPLLYPSLMDEFGWNQEQVTRPAAIKFLFASIFNLAVGFLLDRYAPRPIMGAGALIMVTGLVCFVFMGSLPLLTIDFSAFGSDTVFNLDTLFYFTTFYLLLAFGLSMCGLIPSMLTTSRWFTKYRGRAVGILLMASSFGGAVLPLIIKGSLEIGNWQQAIMILAAIGFVGMFLPVIWPLRAKPEEMGTTPDGLSEAESESSETKKLGYAGGASLAEAARMPIFWFLQIATSILWFCISGVVQHQAIYFREQGLSGGDLALTFSLFFWCSIIGKFIFGWLSDHFPKANIMLLAILNLAAGLVILRFADGAGITMIYVYAVVYGIGFSGAFTMVQLLVAELFTGPTYGRILGTFVAADTISAAAGIWAIGTIRVAAGSYIPAIDMMLGMAVVAIISVLAVRRIVSQREPHPAAAE